VSIDADSAYCIWSAETADNVYELGTDTLVVRGGQIVAQSYAGKITPRARLNGPCRTLSSHRTAPHGKAPEDK
jgi:hypothetical protein